METKNISRQDTQVKEYLERGYAELEKRNWEFAKISFDKVISLDANCGKAYVGRALAKAKISKFDSLQTNADEAYSFFELIYSDFGHVNFTDKESLVEAEKKRKIMYSDEELRVNLCQTAYISVLPLIRKDEIYKAINLLNILNYCLGEYRDSKDRLKLCEKYEEISSQAYRFNYSKKRSFEDALKNPEKEKELKQADEYEKELKEYIREKLLYEYREKIMTKGERKTFNILNIALLLSSLIYLLLLKILPSVNSSIVMMPVFFLVMLVPLVLTLAIFIKMYGGYDCAPKFTMAICIFLSMFMGVVLSLILFCIVYYKEKQFNEKMIYWENKISNCQSKIDAIKSKYERQEEELKKELVKELVYKIQTMLGDDIETFELEAQELGFMVGYGKFIVKKYSKI